LKKNSSGFFDCGVGVVHQDHEDEKNSSEFFEPFAKPLGAFSVAALMIFFI
jgi:hypothetical protein